MLNPKPFGIMGAPKRPHNVRNGCPRRVPSILCQELHGEGTCSSCCVKHAQYTQGEAHSRTHKERWRPKRFLAGFFFFLLTLYNVHKVQIRYNIKESDLLGQCYASSISLHICNASIQAVGHKREGNRRKWPQGNFRVGPPFKRTRYKRQVMLTWSSFSMYIFLVHKERNRESIASFTIVS